MKKYVYYMTPFIFVPTLMLLCDFLDNINMIHMSPYILVVVLTLCCIAVGIFSPADKNFDYIITMIMPVSFFGIMFIGGFLDRGCSGKPELSFIDAFDTAFQPWCIIVYCIMAVITFLASFKAIRVMKRIKSR